MRRAKQLPVISVVLVGLIAAIFCGCEQGAINENKQLLEQQQTQLDQMKQQLAAVQAQQASAAYRTATPPPGGCDTAVLKVATRKGGERFGASDFSHALGYYQDAATACPQSAQAQLNLARTYEAIGDREHALPHYRLAASATGAHADAVAVQHARDALARLGG
ncbi:MAG: hypothetical protein ACREQN_12300 [Candidatus Binataceae bacterium]